MTINPLSSQVSSLKSRRYSWSAKAFISFLAVGVVASAYGIFSIIVESV